jgi:hypothetical protein
VRFSRHAKNRARGLEISVADAERLIANPISVDSDPAGKPRYLGIWQGQYVREAAVAAPDRTITMDVAVRVAA